MSIVRHYTKTGCLAEGTGLVTLALVDWMYLLELALFCVNLSLYPFLGDRDFISIMYIVC